MRQRQARRRGELERPVAQQACVPVSLLAPRECEVGDDLRAGEHLDAVEHLRLDRGALALARERGHLRSQAPDLLDPPRRPQQMDVDAEADVRPGDDRGHHAPAVADLLEQLDGALVPPHARLELRSDRRVGQDLVRRLTGRQAHHDCCDLAALDLLHVPLAHPRDGGDPELAERGGLGGNVAQLLGELARSPEGFGSGIEVDLLRCAERLAEGTPHQVLPQLQARRQLGRAVAARVGNLAHRPRQLGGLILVLGHAQRGSAAQLDVELEVRVTESLRERRQLGQAFEAVGGAAQHAQAFVAGGEQRERGPAPPKRPAGPGRRCGAPPPPRGRRALPGRPRWRNALRAPRPPPRGRDERAGTCSRRAGRRRRSACRRAPCGSHAAARR